MQVPKASDSAKEEISKWLKERPSWFWDTRVQGWKRWALIVSSSYQVKAGESFLFKKTKTKMEQGCKLEKVHIPPPNLHSSAVKRETFWQVLVFFLRNSCCLSPSGPPSLRLMMELSAAALVNLNQPISSKELSPWPLSISSDIYCNCSPCCELSFAKRVPRRKKNGCLVSRLFFYLREICAGI